MLRNYLIVTIRNLTRNKTYSFINIGGLAVALACCLIIFQYVSLESSVDAFHTDASQLYRITGTFSVPGADGQGLEVDMTHAGPGFAPFFVENIPEVTQYARIMPDFFQDEGSTINYIDDNTVRTFKNIQAFYTEPEFLDLFSFPLVAGDAESALQQPNSLLITESAAEKYFGQENPIGKTLLHNSLLGVAEYNVVGVLKDLPSNSHLQFEMLLPIRDLEYLVGGNIDGVMDVTTGFVEFTSYVKLQSGADAEATAQKMTDAISEFAADRLAALQATMTMDLQPVTDIYFDTETADTMVVKGERSNIYLFSLIALLTLTIALINYVNLTTARAVNRGKEVGIRKVVGAGRGELIRQFMFESVITNLIAFVIALVIAVQLIPVVNNVIQTQLTIDSWKNPVFLRIFAAVFFLGILLSGLGPAFLISSFKPINILKGKVTAFGSKSQLRRGFVVFQFACSIALIASTGVVYSQLQFMQNYDGGMDMDRVLIIPRPNVVSGGPENLTEGTPNFMARLTQLANAETALIDRVSQLACVQEAAYSETAPGRGYHMISPATLRDADLSETVMVGVTTIDHRFVDLYGLQVVAGEPFQEATMGWSATRSAGISPPALINEAAARALGLPTNEEAVGQDIALNDDGPPYQIRGVLEDFNWQSLHQTTDPMVFRYSPRNHYMSVRINTEDVSYAITEIGAAYNELFPYDLFEYQFADESFNMQYKADERFAILFVVFASLSILIGCLGLYGLAAYAAQRRTKEIGIRKVVGASVPQVVGLLSREFLALVLIANVIAWPLAWYAMRRWLENFAYRIDLGIGVFILAGLLALVIAFLTVSWQTIRAAMANPVESLRYE